MARHAEAEGEATPGAERGDAHGPLNGQDAAFLAFEDFDHPMQVGALVWLEAGDAAAAGAAGAAGGLDGGALTRLVRQRMEALPRFRQRLAPGRLGRKARWVPAPHRALHRQVREVASPLPSHSARLRRRIERLFEAPLDLAGPPWEIFVLSGIDGGRRALLLVKAHHALLDGASAVSALARAVDGLAGAVPQPPSRDRAARLPALPSWRGLLGLLVRVLRRCSALPLHGPGSPRRRIRTLALDAAALEDHARARGATLNDAVLALVSGALGEWLAGLGHGPGGRRARAMCPVDLRRGGPGSGNQLGAWLVDLPVDEPRGDARLARIRASTAEARRGGHARSVGWLGRVAEWLPAWFPRLGMRFCGAWRAFDLVVTQPPAVPEGLRIGGARIERLQALAPVFPGQRCTLTALRTGNRLEISVNGAGLSARDANAWIEALRRSAPPQARLPEPGREREQARVPPLAQAL